MPERRTAGRRKPRRYVWTSRDTYTAIFWALAGYLAAKYGWLING
jgi:hypothetical protein